MLPVADCNDTARNHEGGMHLSIPTAGRVLLLFFLTLIAGGITAIAFARLSLSRALVVFVAFWLIFLLLAVKNRLD
jgi:hypothetical protein